jgi:hypothetical protein
MEGKREADERCGGQGQAHGCLRVNAQWAIIGLTAWRDPGKRRRLVLCDVHVKSGRVREPGRVINHAEAAPAAPA